MNAERWQRVEELYHAALERTPKERTAFLKEACPDEDLRREVESLVASESSANSVLDQPAWQRRLAAGERLGPYEIVEQIGAGGMGEVWKARDTRLDRTVAVKLCAERFSARFEREARAIAALNHPHICTLYDVGPNYLVMEYVEGQPLKGPLPVEKAVEYARQILDGLEAAHARGIVHRDLKPANVLATKSGVKLLDFGLAKMQRAPSSVESQEIATVTEEQTIVGTPQYMAPEQIEGKPVDARTDIFAFGCVLHELLTGQRAFAGNSPSSIMAAVLASEPAPVSKLQPATPVEIDRIVSACLAKDPQQRFQSVRDARRALDWAMETRASPQQTRPRPHLPGAWIMAALTIALVSATLYWRNRPASPIDSLAILPFANAGGDPNAEYLSDGISEQLINRLSQASELRVTARSLAFRYKGPEVDPLKAGRELRVRAVLTGRVVERAGGLNIQVDLINVEDGSQLWGKPYSRGSSEILTLQEEIVRDVSEKLGLTSTIQHQKRPAKRSTENIEAYQAYLRGRYYWNRRTEQTIKRAAEYFQQAIDKDPAYALAYAGLADCYATYPGYQVESPRESWPKAKFAATKALEIDDTLAEAHATLGSTRMSFEWDWAGAEREFKRSIELDPNYPSAHQWYSEYLAATGRTEQAIASSKRAQQLDPLSLIINANVGSMLSYARRHDEAIEQIRKTIEMDPTFFPGHWYLGRSYTYKAMYPEAIAELQKAMELSGKGHVVLGFLGNAYALSGHRDAARRALADLHEFSKSQFVASISRAFIYAGLGDKERAFEWLEKSLVDKSRGVIFLKVEPNFDSLRSDPRFTNLVRRIGLEP